MVEFVNLSVAINEKNLEKIEEIKRVIMRTDPERFKNFGAEEILQLALTRNMRYVLEEELKAQKWLEYERARTENKK